MDLLRFEDKRSGPIYVDGRSIFFLARDGDDTNVGVVIGGFTGKDLIVSGDVDEVAASIERAVPGARIHRIV
jgi:hypothetical protein